MTCPKGNGSCLKACSTADCRASCEFADVCCTERCIFEPNSLIARIQGGEEGLFESTLHSIEHGTNDQFEDIMAALGACNS